MNKWIFIFVLVSCHLILKGQNLSGMSPRFTNCIVNNQLTQTETFVFRIEDSIVKSNFNWKIDSMIIDTLGWYQEKSIIDLYRNSNGSMKLKFPYRISLNVSDTLYCKINTLESIGFLKPFIKARIYKDSSLVPVVVDESVFNFLFKDSLSIIKVTTENFPINIPKDSVCSNYSPNSFVINSSNNEKSYQWTLDNVLVSNTSSYIINKSGVLKLEVLLKINSCKATNVPKTLYYETYPEKAELTSDAFFTMLYLKNYPIVDNKSYKTFWFKDDQLFQSKVTDSSVSFPLDGIYYAILEGKICKKKTNAVIVSNNTSKIDNFSKAPFYSIANNQLIFNQSGRLLIYEINGQKLKDIEVSENQQIDISEVKKNTLIIQFEKNLQTYFTKLLIK